MLTKRVGARFDLGLLLFNARDSLRELWDAADRYTRSRDDEALDELRDAVEKLRPLCGSVRKKGFVLNSIIISLTEAQR